MGKGWPSFKDGPLYIPAAKGLGPEESFTGNSANRVRRVAMDFFHGPGTEEMLSAAGKQFLGERLPTMYPRFWQPTSQVLGKSDTRGFFDDTN